MSKTIIASSVTLAVLITSWLFINRDESGSFVVSQRGHYPIGKNAAIHVFTADNGLFNISYSVDGSEQQWKDGIIDPNETWSIYVYNRNEMWLIEDDDVTYIFNFDRTSGNYGLFNCNDPSVLNGFVFQRMPQEAVQLLPEGIMKRISTAQQQNRVLESDRIFAQLNTKMANKRM